ncbi:MAG: hypothetical protein L0G99_01165 [Propionibacteriales bacterium]|nr:hypothetical protein [Propionibacteriales bacterium]
MSWRVGEEGVADQLRGLLGSNSEERDDVAVLIEAQAQYYESPDGTLLALVMVALMHEELDRSIRSELMAAVNELDNLPRLPIEVPTYALSLDRSVDYVDAYCEGIIDMANEDRPDRPPLGSVVVLEPLVFLDEVRQAFAGETGRPPLGNEVERGAIALAAELGRIHRASPGRPGP